MIDNRHPWKANVSADVAVIHNVTFTPTFKYMEAKYGIDPPRNRDWQTAANGPPALTLPM